MYVFLLALPALESTLCNLHEKYNWNKIITTVLKSEPYKYILITVITLRRTPQASDYYN